MPYNDPVQQKRAQHASYLRNQVAVQGRTKQRRIELGEKVKRYKLQKGCQRCGFNAHPSALDLHHVGDKGPNNERGREWAVSRLIHRNFAWVKIQAELMRCEVICANYHRIEHTPR